MTESYFFLGVITYFCVCACLVDKMWLGVFYLFVIIIITQYAEKLSESGASIAIVAIVSFPEARQEKCNGIYGTCVVLCHVTWAFFAFTRPQSLY